MPARHQTRGLRARAPGHTARAPPRGLPRGEVLQPDGVCAAPFSVHQLRFGAKFKNSPSSKFHSFLSSLSSTVIVLPFMFNPLVHFE